MANKDKSASSLSLKSIPKSYLAFTLIALLALALRIIAVLPIGYYHPDEIFQYLEQAHRLAFGYSVIPWEYRYGMRGGLVPVLLAMAMKAGDIINNQSYLYWVFPHAITAILSMGVVWSAYRLGRPYSLFVACLAMFVAATWYEIVLFAAHPLSESLSFSAFMPAAFYLCSTKKSVNTLIAAGFLMGLSALLRFQYIPSIIFISLFTLKFNFKHWVYFIFGGLFAILISSLSDIFIGEYPLLWLLKNIQQNLLYHRANDYGIAPLYGYFLDIGTNWKWLALLLPFPICVAAYRYPALFGAALTNLAFHMLISHKEYRFIFLSSGIFIILGAIGSGLLVEKWTGRLSNPLKYLSRTAVFAIWAAASLFCSNGNSGHWYQYRGVLQAEMKARSFSELCGLVLYQIDYWQSGGYSLLHRRIPIYSVLPTNSYGTRYPDTATLSSSLFLASNAVITAYSSGKNLPKEYRPMGCYQQKNGEKTEDICLFLRAGSCFKKETADNFEINKVLKNIDQ
ncbi:MAG: mannosyltransferase [Zymomonas mobilis]|uniref:Alg9-like mannosyltransferase family protein n=1 Tax=Zymomonas mobilis TaxID=542 RepID=A0A542W110_ZYMMB|nr:mannosyltransferase [Zymomonas mobilis]TQL17271.1 Alg9-like mannosyltransferase family protein [Zymomonas mobilis]